MDRRPSRLAQGVHYHRRPRLSLAGCVARARSQTACASARETAMLVCALCVVPIVFVSQTSNIWVAVALIGLAASAHQGWSANVFTMTSDLFPRRAVGSVVGIGGMAGAVGGMLIAKVVGYVLEWTGSYLPIFIIAGSAFLTALLIVHLLVPRFAPAGIKKKGAA